MLPVLRSLPPQVECVTVTLYLNPKGATHAEDLALSFDWAAFHDAFMHCRRLRTVRVWLRTRDLITLYLRRWVRAEISSHFSAAFAEKFSFIQDM